MPHALRTCHAFYFFFFQAEDGIRDYKVTGVQTCALPISEEKGLLQWAYPPLAGNSRDSGRMIACLETIPAPCNSSADVGGHLAVWPALRSGASICLHAEHPLTHPSEFPKLRRLSRCLCQLHIVAKAPQAFASSVQDFLDLRKKQ